MISEDRYVIHVTYFHVCGKIPDRSKFKEERGFFWLMVSEGAVYHGGQGTAQCPWKCEMLYSKVGSRAFKPQLDMTSKALPQ